MAAEYEAAGASLEANTVALGAAIKSVYGDDAEKNFLTLWRNHIGFFVDYTVGTATKDDGKKTKATQDLAGYGRDFGAFIGGANPNLPASAVEGLLTATSPDWPRASTRTRPRTTRPPMPRWSRLTTTCS